MLKTILFLEEINSVKLYPNEEDNYLDQACVTYSPLQPEEPLLNLAPENVIQYFILYHLIFFEELMHLLQSCRVLKS